MEPSSRSKVNRLRSIGFYSRRKKKYRRNNNATAVVIQGENKKSNYFNHHHTGHIAHHSAMSLMLPLPAPGSTPKRAPIPWNADEPYKGLGCRRVEMQTAMQDYKIKDFPIKG